MAGSYFTELRLKRVCSRDRRIQLVRHRRAKAWARTLLPFAALGYTCPSSGRPHRPHQVPGHCNSRGCRLASQSPLSFLSCFFCAFVAVVDLVCWNLSIFCSCSHCQGMKEASGDIQRGPGGNFPLQFLASCVWLVWESMREEDKFRQGITCNYQQIQEFTLRKSEKWWFLLG